MKDKKELIDLYTEAGEKLLKSENAIPWDVYPRPQLKRDSFLNLNGLWEFETSKKDKIPEYFSQNILVPFVPESLLSGIHKVYEDGTYLYYKHEFTLPDGFLKDRLLLNFGAVDREAWVYINGKEAGYHIGGYDAFSLDITDLIEKNATNTIIVKVLDKLSDPTYPYGKQKYNRGGMWYTPCSGIWQTVWLESVRDEYIRSIKIDTGLDFAEISIFSGEVPLKGKIKVRLITEEKEAEITDGKVRIDIPEPKLWSPESPYLYYFEIETEKDKICSYFALRTLEIKEIDGTGRLCLNGKPYFFNGLLDQGYYSDGLFTPAEPEEYERDVLKMKSLGFNMLRKHIKVEPEIFYYDCDRFGMVVFQDMVNNGKYSFIRDTALPTIGMKYFPDKILHTDKETRKQFRKAMKKEVEQLYNHPSICLWTVFNEGWGQFDSDNMYDYMRSLDSTRFIDTTSGWFKAKKNDVESEHVYFKKVNLKKPKSKKPIFLSEFGGYSFKPENHVANTEATYGYGKFENREDFVKAFRDLYLNEVIPFIDIGLCAAVYTQVSDVEDETNGILTYDRKVMKIKPEEFKDIAEKVKI